MSTGLAGALLIYLWVSNELSVDKFHEKEGQLYQVLTNHETPQGIETGDMTPVPLAEALLTDMPEVDKAVVINDFRTWNNREGILSFGEKHLKVQGMHAGKEFFNVFSFPLLDGNPNQVLAEKSGIVISEELAKKLFRTSENAVGKILEWSHPGFEGTYKVSGVFAPQAISSMSPFDVVFSIDVLLEKQEMASEWDQSWGQTFVVLKKETNIREFNQKLKGYLKEKDEAMVNLPLLVQKYSDKYLYGQYENGVPVAGRMQYVKFFSLIALFILLIACVNFMNLATAKASLRLKEIGVKKAIGASRQALIIQYLSESMLLTMVSLLVAIILVVLLLPQFNGITGKHLQLMLNTRDIIIMLGIVVFTGLVSGLYPAFYLSGFNTITVLKNKLDTSVGELWIRKGLVVFQFSLAVIFIVGFLIIHKQIEYTQTKNLGYSKDNVITFKWQGKFDSSFEAFISEMKNIPGVVNATSMSGNIRNDVWGQSALSWRGQEADRGYTFKSPLVSYHFIQTLGIELLQGRTFQKNIKNERRNIILNEAAVKMMDLKDPVGQSIQWEEGSRTIIGVVKDFHYGSLHNKIEPLIFRFDSNGGNVLVKIKTGTEKSTLAQLKQFQAEFLPLYPFEFTFMDDDYRALYESESRIAVLSNYIAALAIIISCLGLFGLAAFTAERRRKEIGIRKVLGASRFSIVYLLSGDFTKLVLVSIFLSLPLSYLIIKNWLQNFEYRIDLEWWYFVGAGVAALLIAWLTVSTQAIRAASVNPAHILKDE
ncbi:MAG: Acidobacterial duplicated orphan permease (function unknown) [uncultured Segetibacter sp.]|uniref:ABC transporter, permease protein n=1 Tax=uncultured Segetibacter sp. TaxID=481133 RepID=A0A6J4RZA7_9BACT|nr:MAG: Acidobacterial duplicated orphan permease (function unknown) [uncultured Segetibacter sp.]